MILQEKRKAVGLTQKELAEQSSATQQMISAIEKGETVPSVSLAKRLASVLGIDWTEFFKDE